MTTNVATPVIIFIAAGGNDITLESYENLGPQSSVMITTLDFENGTRTDEIIDVDVNEKRRRDDILRRRVRPRLEDILSRTPALLVPLANATPSPPPNVISPLDIIMQDVQVFCHARCLAKKYRFGSEIDLLIY